MRPSLLRPFTLAPVLVLGLAFSPKSLSLLSSILLVGVLITLHELGHFLAARWMKTPVEIFSIGFGPRLWGFRYQETDVRLSAIPLGGYVKLEGEVGEAGQIDDATSDFLKQPYYKRMTFYAGGIVANVLTAFVILVGIGIHHAAVVEVKPISSPLVVDQVIPGGAADKAGLKPGDQIQRLGALAFPGASDQDAVALIRRHAGQPLDLELSRMGSRVRLQATPAKEGDIGRLGITFSPSRLEYVRRAFQVKDLAQGLKFGAVATGVGVRDIGVAFGRLFTFRSSASEVGGPIAIVKTGSQAAQGGPIAFFSFAAIMSLNLAVLNALPIPGLDGSHMAILTFERLRGRDLSLRVKERILTTGFFLLLGLLVVVLGMDVTRLFKG